MTPVQFIESWASIFPDTIPVQYRFKQDYFDRWFRIHSLPGSKRYADTDEEWATLLYRQNTIITDLLGDNSSVLLVAGDYDDNENTGDHITETEPCYSNYHFQRISDIDLNAAAPADYMPGDIYRPAFAQVLWQPNMHNPLLMSIANDETRAFFVVFDQQLLIAPYDGGIDIILWDAATRDAYKAKYKAWLSVLDNGH